MYLRNRLIDALVLKNVAINCSTLFTDVNIIGLTALVAPVAKS